jgi:hypothetical protein
MGHRCRRQRRVLDGHGDQLADDTPCLVNGPRIDDAALPTMDAEAAHYAILSLLVRRLTFVTPGTVRARTSTTLRSTSST